MRRRQASLRRPLWIMLVGGRAAHAVIGQGLDTVCGLEPEIADAPPWIAAIKRCVRCEARLKAARAAAKEIS